MRRTLLLTAAALLAVGGAARASDPIGVYALVTKVVTEPSQGDAERVQVFGVFRLADRKSGDDYQPAAYGYLYYSLAPGKAGDSRREWTDLKRVEGTGDVIAFASRYQALGTVRKAADKPDKPDPYPIASGLHRIRAADGIGQELRSLAPPTEPADGGEAAPGAVTLRAHAIADKERKDVKYVFEISNARGDKETSQPVEAGARADTASWKPKMQVKPSEEYTWRVWAVAGDWKGPALTATFKAKKSAE
jgi:hypothetical protein